VRSELDRHGAWVEEYSIPHSLSTSPITGLSDFLGAARIVPERPWTIEHLYEALEGRPEAILLDHAANIVPDQLCRLLQLLNEWAEYSQALAGRSERPISLCLFLPAPTALSNIPPTNVYLSVRYWWMIPSALEMQLLCRLRHGSNRRDSASLWREHVLPSLAGGDAELIDILWDEPDISTDALVTRLKMIAAERCWTPQYLRSLNIETALRNAGAEEMVHSHPPNQRLALWAYGILGATPEYGIEVHPAALAALGHHEAIRHRLWRAQARALLPFIDHVRLYLCEELTRVHGKDWPVRWHVPHSEEEEAAVRVNPLACQWGHLDWLVRNCDALRGAVRWRNLVSLCRWVRNELSHYRPINLRDFEGLRTEALRMLRGSVQI
jgi:hypothetical protein